MHQTKSIKIRKDAKNLSSPCPGTTGEVCSPGVFNCPPSRLLPRKEAAESETAQQPQERGDEVENVSDQWSPWINRSPGKESNVSVQYKRRIKSILALSSHRAHLGTTDLLQGPHTPSVPFRRLGPWWCPKKIYGGSPFATLGPLDVEQPILDPWVLMGMVLSFSKDQQDLCTGC